MHTLRQDLAYALRMLRKSKVFTFTAVSAIALGAAAVTTVYTVVDAVLLRGAPGVRDPGQLVAVQRTNFFRNGFSNMSYPLYRDLRDGTSTLSGLAAYADMRMDVAMTSSATPERMAGEVVTGNYFDVLGVRPAAGRFFMPSEDRVPVAAPVAVISYRLWSERFKRSPDAIGRTILVQATPFTIVGVAPEGFNGTNAFTRQDVYVPTMMTPVIRRDNEPLLASWRSGWLMAFGRLRPTVSRAVAQRELDGLADVSRRREGMKDEMRTQVTQLRAVPANGVAPVSLFLAVLMTVAGLVLLIASTNVASMLLARGLSRRKEFVVRLALGADRLRLVRQLLTESLVLFVIGGGVGVLLTGWVTRLVARADFGIDVPLDIQLPIDARVLTFTLAVSLAVGLLFGLFPALNASRRDLAGVLRGDTSGGGSRKERARSVFVVGQLAMSVLLLVCAGLFVRAFAKGRLVKPGYVIDNVVVAPFALASAGYDTARSARFYSELAQRIAARPDVRAVGTSDMIPLTTSSRVTGIDIPGVVPPPRLSHTMVPYETVSRGFFDALQIPLVQGRPFDGSDGAASQRVAVVTQRFVQRYVHDGAALGKTFTLEGKTYAIVGVVGDARFVSVTDEPEPFMFLLEAQNPDANLNFFVRVANGGSTAAVMKAIADESRALDPRISVPKVQRLSDAASIGLLPHRIAAGTTAVLGLVGLLLASLGLYGVIAFSVNQRTRELGIRMALGADPGRLLAMVLSEGLRLVGVGTVIGLAIAALGSRALSSFLFGVSPWDPVTLIAVPATLAAVALAATWVPARRAGRVGVAVALRAD